MDLTTLVGIIIAIGVCAFSCYLNGAKLLRLEETIRDLEDQIRKKADSPGYYDRYATERFVLEGMGHHGKDLLALLDHLDLEFVNEGRKLVPRKPPES